MSVPYWAIAVSLFAGGSTFAAQWVPPDACTDDAGRCLQQPVAQQTMQQIRAAGSAHVVSVETERVREGPPLPFDLGTLQEVCSKQLGLDVQETGDRPGPVRDAQGHDIPRSDSGYLPGACLPKCPPFSTACLRPIPRCARS